ncbi:MAG TPA: DUF401 family protein [Clostridia bacterium]|nr:DUF401 family protein [Clostridia bacterium]
MELVGLGISLILVVLITSKWHHVSAAMIIGSIVLALSMSMDINAIGNMISKVAFSYDTIELVAAVLLITLLSTVMYQTLLLEDLLSALIRLIKSIHLLLVIILPAMGLLAVPGGAIISAPFADKLGDKINMDSGSKSAINIFFRHTSAFVNPLAPALIMVADLTKIGFGPIIKFFTLPVFVSILLGLLILIKVWPDSDNGVHESETARHSEQSRAHALKQFFISGSPIILALGLAGSGMSFILVLMMALLLSFYLDRKTHCILHRSNIKDLFLNGINWQLGLAVFTILLFGAFVQNNEAIPLLAEMIHKIDMPFVLILLTTSIIIGFVAGHPIVGSAILYPIFMPLVGHDIAGITYLSLIFFGIMFGYIVSPIHLCLIVSNEFFGVGYKEVYPPLLLLQLVLLVSVLATALILIWI